MKKQNASLFAVLLAASTFFFACTDKVKKDAGALEFDSLQVNRTEHLFGDTAKPACNIVMNIAFVKQSSDSVMKDSLNTFMMAMCLGDKYMNQTPAGAITAYADNYVKSYRSDLEPMYNKESLEDNVGAWYSYYKGIEGRVQYYRKDLLVYRMDFNEYTGGAHGIYMSSFLNMDLKTLTPIRLADLFVPDYELSLTDLLWNQLMADNNVATHEELEDMGYTSTGDLTPTENFYLSEEGITFYYNVYEIAPYVMGPVKITLPFDAVRHLLSDSKLIENIER